VWGRQDEQLRPALAERLAQDIPQAELTWVDDASHFVPCDRPDLVADAVLRLLVRPPSSASRP
jgi:pimeloyl-ACP methyl ester carboxylesterase